MSCSPLLQVRVRGNPTPRLAGYGPYRRRKEETYGGWQSPAVASSRCIASWRCCTLWLHNNSVLQWDLEVAIPFKALSQIHIGASKSTQQVFWASFWRWKEHPVIYWESLLSSMGALFANRGNENVHLQFGSRKNALNRNRGTKACFTQLQQIQLRYVHWAAHFFCCAPMTTSLRAPLWL